MSGRCYAPTAQADPLRSPHGGCRRPGGAQRPGTGPPTGDRPPRRPGRARQRALGSGRGPGRRRGTGRRSRRCPSFRPTRPEDTVPGAGRSTTARHPDARPRRSLPPVRGLTRRRGRPSAADGIAAGCHTVILTAAAGGIRDDLGHRDDHGRRGPSQPDRTQPSERPRVRGHGRRVQPLGSGPWPCPPRSRRFRARAPAGRLCPAAGPQFETPAEIRMLGRWVPTSSACRWRSKRSRPSGRSRRPGAGPDHQSGRIGRFHDRPREIADVGVAAVPAVAAIVRHVVGSLA